MAEDLFDLAAKCEAPSPALFRDHRGRRSSVLADEEASATIFAAASVVVEHVRRRGLEALAVWIEALLDLARHVKLRVLHESPADAAAVVGKATRKAHALRVQQDSYRLDALHREDDPSALDRLLLTSLVHVHDALRAALAVDLDPLRLGLRNEAKTRISPESVYRAVRAVHRANGARAAGRVVGACRATLVRLG